MRHQFSGQRLRERRKAARVPGERLAYESGRSLYSIAAYESGRSVPSAEVVARMADVLGCEPGDFFEVVDKT